MSDKELLEMIINDIELLKLILDRGDIDVYGFCKEVIHLKDFVEGQMKINDEHHQQESSNQ
jgi:hypothetical protein